MNMRRMRRIDTELVCNIFVPEHQMGHPPGFNSLLFGGGRLRPLLVNSEARIVVWWLCSMLVYGEAIVGLVAGLGLLDRLDSINSGGFIWSWRPDLFGR